MKPEIRSVAVFCGSSDGWTPVYVERARALGQALAAHDLGLVYGGAGIGLMGAVADGCLEAGGRVIGILPEALANIEVAHALLDVRITADFHARKAAMYVEADGFVVLPGGAGTLDEFFEVLTWAQIGLHAKPVVLWNLEGFFDALLAHLDRAAADGFLPQRVREGFAVADSSNADDVVAALRRPDAASGALRARGAPARCALSEARRVGDLAGQEGFDWPSVAGAWWKVGEELDELRAADRAGDPVAVRDEFGDLLFAVVALSRWLEVDPAETLRDATERFRQRVVTVRTLAAAPLGELSLEELVDLWRRAKHLTAADAVRPST